MRLLLITLIAGFVAVQNGFAGTSPCKENAAPSDFQSSDSVWWGNVERAHTPYLEFAKSDLGDPAPKPDEVYTVYFDLKKAELSAGAVATLNEVYAYLDTNDAIRARVEYPSGGRRNADAVKNWLVSQGINGDRIETTGAAAGQSGPMATVRIRLVD
jgi:outer membrane protein OmpA-like peptidoglycan-associated protein